MSSPEYQSCHFYIGPIGFTDHTAEGTMKLSSISCYGPMKYTLSDRWNKIIVPQTEYLQTRCLWWEAVDSWFNYTPAQWSWRGVYWIHLVRPSVRPSVCLYTTWFLAHKSSFLWNFNFKFHMHIDGGHRQKPFDFQQHHFQNGRLAAILDFLVSGL